MITTYQTPGVYLEQQFLQPQPSLSTGIPGFVGFAEAINSQVSDQIFTLHRYQEFTDNFVAPGYLDAAIQGFFANGGSRCYITPINPRLDGETALIQAIQKLASLTDLDLLAAPDIMKLTNLEAIIRVQTAMIEHCNAQGDRFALLDAVLTHDISTSQSINKVKSQRQQLTQNQLEPVNAAFYYPWLQVQTSKGTLGFVPPCGHIAGIIARSDRTSGVFKAPANEEIRGVLDLEINLSNNHQAQLNSLGINCLRTFPGRGIRVWGARTLSLDVNWRYINVRRMVLTLKRWIEQNMQWITFEPNTPQLWVRIQRELSGYLSSLWQSGGLQGNSPEQAFYVKCDIETNPPEIPAQGKLITEIGLATATPAEFLVVRITHRAESTEINL